jgi:acetyl esterase/lipase
MKKYLLLLTFFAALSAKAQMAPIHLWPKNRLIDTINGHEMVEHDISKPGEGLISGKPIIRLADISDPTITVYSPPNPNGIAVIVCPGGGYSILAMDLEGTELCTWFNSFGVTAILLKYRVPAPAGKLMYELPLQDAQRALGLVRSNAAKWHIDPTHIGIMGFSAGGHLTAALSNNYKSRTYAPVDNADTVSCKPNFAIIIYPGYLTDTKVPGKLPPEVQVTADTPPTFVVQAEDDPVHVENALTYYAELKKFKIPAELFVFPVGGHGYGIRSKKGDVSLYPDLLKNWLLNSF